MAGTRLSAATLVIGMIRISSTMLASPPRSALAIAFRLNCGFDSDPASSDIGVLLYALIIKPSHERIEGRCDPSRSSDLGVGGMRAPSDRDDVPRCQRLSSFRGTGLRNPPAFLEWTHLATSGSVSFQCRLAHV